MRARRAEITIFFGDKAAVSCKKGERTPSRPIAFGSSYKAQSYVVNSVFVIFGEKILRIVCAACRWALSLSSKIADRAHGVGHG